MRAKFMYCNRIIIVGDGALDVPDNTMDLMRIKSSEFNEALCFLSLK